MIKNLKSRFSNPITLFTPSTVIYLNIDFPCVQLRRLTYEISRRSGMYGTLVENVHYLHHKLRRNTRRIRQNIIPYQLYNLSIKLKMYSVVIHKYIYFSLVLQLSFKFRSSPLPSLFFAIIFRWDQHGDTNLFTVFYSKHLKIQLDKHKSINTRL